MRAALAIIAGIVAGFAVMVAIALVGGSLFPGPRIEALNAEAAAAALPSLPLGAKLTIALSWFGGTLAGAYAAKRIAGAAWAAWTVGGVLTAYVLLTLLVLPMPGWLQALGVVAPLLGALIGNHLVAARPVQPEAPAGE